MARTKPDIKPALTEFCAKMDELALECEMEVYEIHRGEDPLWDSLWDHPKMWTLALGALGAALPVMGLLAWHLSRGGVIFN